MNANLNQLQIVKLLLHLKRLYLVKLNVMKNYHFFSGVCLISIVNCPIYYIKKQRDKQKLTNEFMNLFPDTCTQ